MESGWETVDGESGCAGDEAQFGAAHDTLVDGRVPGLDPSYCQSGTISNEE